MATTLPIVKTPADLLALLPYQFGFTPRECVAVAGLRAASLKVATRVDLADLARTPRIAYDLAARLLENGATDLFLAVYTSQDLSGPSQEWPAHIHAAIGALTRTPLHFLDAWVVGPYGFYHLGCADMTCCPPGGRDLAELESSAVAAAMVYSGRAVLADRSQLAQVTPVDGSVRRRTYRALARRLSHPSRTQDHLLWCEVAVAAWMGLVRGKGPAPPAELGKFLAGMCEPLVRDAVLVSLVPGLNEHLVDVCGREYSYFYQAVEAILSPDSAVVPDHEHLLACDRVLQAALAHAPGVDLSGVWAVRALLQWWHGNATMASVCAQKALEARSDQPLATAVYQLVSAGQAPGWVMRETERESLAGL